MFAFCSTTRIDTPASCTCLMISKFRSTRIGASPIDGSSIKQQLRPGHQRAAHRDHLLLAARERPGELVAPLVQQREERVDAVEVLLAPPRPRRYAPISRFSRTRHRREQPPVLRDDRHAAPDPVARSTARSRPRPANSTVPLRGWTMPRIVFSVVDLPEALPPSRHTSSPSPTSQFEPREDVDLPVVGVDAAKPEQHRSPPRLRVDPEIGLDHARRRSRPARTSPRRS